MSLNILLIDDEAPIRRLARRMLEKANAQVTEADGVASALSALAAMPSPPQVALVDLTLPDGDGRDLVVQLRAAVPDIRIVYFSGYPQHIVERITVNNTDTFYLQKPFSPLQIRELLATLEA